MSDVEPAPDEDRSNRIANIISSLLHRITADRPNGGDSAAHEPVPEAAVAGEDTPAEAVLPEDPATLIANVIASLLHRKATPKEQDHWQAEMRAGTPAHAFLQAVLTCPEFRDKQPVTPLFRLGHFYSPVVDPRFAEPYVAKVDPTQRRLPGIRIDDDAMLALWCSFDPYLEPRPFPIRQTEGHRYWFANRAFAFNDGTVLHCMLRHLNPKRVIEVGSGYSSCCILETAERFLREDIELTFIDPRPQLVQELFGADEPRRKVEVLEAIVQDIPLSTFEALEENDILFIDSTHVMKTASDVNYELLEVLPRLKSGVYVHFHDIFWPFEYPARWSVTDNRSWNEIYALRAFLAFNRAFEIVFFNDYFWRFHNDELVLYAPWLDRNSGGGSIWLRRR
jgi:predicted O-methyltransferase YrrM